MQRKEAQEIFLALTLFQKTCPAQSLKLKKQNKTNNNKKTKQANSSSHHNNGDLKAWRLDRPQSVQLPVRLSNSGGLCSLQDTLYSWEVWFRSCHCLCLAHLHNVIPSPVHLSPETPATYTGTWTISLRPDTVTYGIDGRRGDRQFFLAWFFFFTISAIF